MIDIIYRLGDFKIIESDAGILHWEAHSGVGMLKEGSCYIKGGILFIGPADNQKEGFLKLEFIESFKDAQAWSKTGYFCTNVEIFSCTNGKKVTRDEMLLWRLEKQKDKNIGKIPFDLYGRGMEGLTVKQSFRLQKYKISIVQDGNIVWSSHAGANIIKSGPCVILEDILFLYPSRNKPQSLGKEQFTDNLMELLEWQRTKYYASGCLLQVCENVNQVREAEKSRTGFLKTKIVEANRKTKNHVEIFSRDEKKEFRIGKSKINPAPFFPRIKKFLLFMFLPILIISILMILLLIYWTEQKERSYHRGMEYPHRGERKH